MSNEMIEAQATDWVIRQRDPDFADWAEFTEWLEQDARHLEIYDAMASMDADLERLPAPRAPIFASPAPARTMPARRVWLGGAVAAVLVGVVSFSFMGNGGTRIETVAGEHRTINLADGSRIEVNGASVLELDEDNNRFAKLESGEAMFHVVHRKGDPFTVLAGDAKLVDLGTAFNVVRRDNGTSVAVSEGIVVYNPDRENVRIDAGKAIDSRDGGGRPQVQDIDVQSVGGWRTGQLVYNGTSLAEVASDLSRTTGMTITVSANVRALPFRGALLVGDNQQRTIDDLTALAGIRAEKTADGWLLTR